MGSNAVAYCQDSMDRQASVRPMESKTSKFLRIFLPWIATLRQDGEISYLRALLDEKERKLAASDALAMERDDAIRKLERICRARKIQLRNLGVEPWTLGVERSNG